MQDSSINYLLAVTEFDLPPADNSSCLLPNSQIMVTELLPFLVLEFGMEQFTAVCEIGKYFWGSLSSRRTEPTTPP